MRGRRVGEGGDMTEESYGKIMIFLGGRNFFGWSIGRD
jgi:hypothetical protein